MCVGVDRFGGLVGLGGVVLYVACVCFACVCVFCVSVCFCVLGCLCLCLFV